MADLLDESKPLPFRPGESPFRMKGSAFRGHLDYVAEHLPGGVPEMLRGFRDPALAKFFEQKFLPSSYYDIVPLIVAGYVCARQSRKSFSEFLRVRSRYQAQKDIGGVYRVLLKMVSPMSVTERLMPLMAQYVDFLSAHQFKKLGDKRAEISSGGLPDIFVPWFSTVLEAYVDVVVSAAGGKNVRSRVMMPLAPDGVAHGIPTVKWLSEISWE